MKGGPRSRSGPGRAAAALLAALLLTASAAGAARLEVTPHLGWQMGGSLDSDRGEIKVPAAANYGGALGYRVREDGTLELIYNRQQTSLRLRQYAPVAGLQARSLLQ